MGPREWDLTGNKLKKKNLILSQAFQSVASLLRILEKDPESWSCSPIYGHSDGNLVFPLNDVDRLELQDKNIFTVSQIFKTGLNGMLTREFNADLNETLITSPRLLHKLKMLQKTVKQFNPTEHSQRVHKNLEILFGASRNASITHKKLQMKLVDKTIDAPPALATRIRDRTCYVEKQDFINAYLHIKNPLLCSKTKENSFQTLNRTIWTNNRAFN